MARKEKNNPAGNGFDPERAKQVIGACENLYDEIATIKSENMLACKQKRSEIKDIIDDAKAAYGIPKGAVRAVLKIHTLEEQARRARDDQDQEKIDEIDMLRHALGDFEDTPLGQAAQKGA